MSKIGSIFSIIADLIGCAAFIWLILIEICGSGEYNRNIDIHAILVGILSAVVTLLVGWNIYTVIDNKSDYSKLKREINYAHNKMDYNTATTYAFISQLSAIQLKGGDKEILKYNMLQYGLNAMKIYSKFPNLTEEMNLVADSLLSSLCDTSDVLLTIKEREDLLMLIGSIPNYQSNFKLKSIIEALG